MFPPRELLPKTTEPLLSAASEPNWTIRPERPEDAPLVDALNEAAFGPGRFAKSAYRLREGVSQVDALSFVAIEKRALKGSVRFWPVAIVGLGLVLLVASLASRSRRGGGSR